jgi:hypothetical protein
MRQSLFLIRIVCFFLLLHICGVILIVYATARRGLSSLGRRPDVLVIRPVPRHVGHAHHRVLAGFQREFLGQPGAGVPQPVGRVHAVPGPGLALAAEQHHVASLARLVLGVDPEPAPGFQTPMAAPVQNSIIAAGLATAPRLATTHDC